MKLKRNAVYAAIALAAAGSSYAAGASKPNLLVERDTFTSNSITGKLGDDRNRNGMLDKSEFWYYTLELPDRGDKKDISCIPESAKRKGAPYTVSSRKSDKFENHYIVNNTGKRKYVLFHWGNKPGSTRGCILVGTTRKKDWVGNSRVAMGGLNKKLGKVKNVPLTIKNRYGKKR